MSDKGKLFNYREQYLKCCATCKSFMVIMEGDTKCDKNIAPSPDHIAICDLYEDE